MTRGAAQSKFSRLLAADRLPRPSKPQSPPRVLEYAGVQIPTSPERPTILKGDSVKVLRSIDDNTFDAIVTDPPFELGFTRISGRKWDATGIAFSTQLWGEALRVLKPGGNLLAFGSPRTYHRLVVAVEDSGFEVRDTILAWVKSTGFAKSLDISRLLESREESALAVAWAGTGTGLKPAHEPIVVARKRPDGSIVDNIIRHGVGGLNIDAARVLTEDDRSRTPGQSRVGDVINFQRGGTAKSRSHPGGRWPANVVVVHRPDCTLEGECAPDCAAAELDAQSAGAARFFPAFRYQGRASASERPRVDGVAHLTVKPIGLMEWLVGLAALPGQLILDPFAGSGATTEAAMHLGVRSIGIDNQTDHVRQIQQRIGRAQGTAAITPHPHRTH